MPLYQFTCPSCGSTTDKWRVSLQQYVPRPVCTCGTKMNRVLHPPAIEFKGSGWQTKKPVKEGEK
jgi:putative FmdB family regulatory protein